MEQEAAVSSPDEQGNFVCPECKARYPERTVSYSSAAGLSSHRLWRHQVKGSTAGYGDNPRPVKLQKGADGTYSCPDCGQGGFKMPLMVGKHRFSAHGRRTGVSRPRKPIGRPKGSKTQHAETGVQVIVPGPSMVAVYLLGRVEQLIRVYAEQNGLPATGLVVEVGGLMLQSA